MRPSALLLFALIAAAPPGTAPAQTWLVGDSEARWVPFTLTPANQIRFTATIEGRAVAAILDTGVSTSVLTRRFADAAGLAVTPGPPAAAVGGSTAIGWVDSPTLGFGGLNHRGGRLAVATLPDSATGGEAVALLVGRDLLEAFALDIDYDAGRFRLLRSGRMPFRGTGLPLVIGGAAPAYRTDTAIDGQPAQLIVDTGDGNAVTLTAALWRGAARDVPTTTTLSYGVGGSTVTGLAIVPRLAIGSLRAGPTEIAIEDEGGFSRGAGAAGRIGSGFLRRYHVLLDPAAGHMVLAPGRRATMPPLRSTSGLLVTRNGGRLDVLHVMRGGPADIAGWQAGEAICSVDGRTVASDPADAALDWPIGAPGRTVALGLCGGPVRSLTLRAFY